MFASDFPNDTLAFGIPAITVEALPDVPTDVLEGFLADTHFGIEAAEATQRYGKADTLRIRATRYETELARRDAQ